MLVDDLLETINSEKSKQVDIRGPTHAAQLTTTAEARLQAVLEITQKLGRSFVWRKCLEVLDTLFQIFLQADRAFIVLVEGSLDSQVDQDSP